MMMMMVMVIWEGILLFGGRYREADKAQKKMTGLTPSLKITERIMMINFDIGTQVNGLKC